MNHLRKLSRQVAVAAAAVTMAVISTSTAAVAQTRLGDRGTSGAGAPMSTVEAQIFQSSLHGERTLHVDVVSHGTVPPSLRVAHGLTPSAITSGCWYADYHFWASAPLGSHIYDEGYRFNWCASGNTVTSKSMEGQYAYGNWGWAFTQFVSNTTAINGSQARGILTAQFVAAGSATQTDQLCGVAVGYPNGTYGHRYNCNIFAP